MALLVALAAMIGLGYLALSFLTASRINRRVDGLSVSVCVQLVMGSLFLVGAFGVLLLIGSALASGTGRQ